MSNALNGLTKLHSRLRCVANGQADVNAVRAQRNGAVRVTKEPAKPVPEVGRATLEGGLKSLGRDVSPARIGKKQTRLASEVEVSVFVLFNRDDGATPAMITRRSGRIGTGTVPLSGLRKLQQDRTVQSVELAETLKSPDPRISSTHPRKPPPGRHERLNKGHLEISRGKRVSLNRIGENVLVGIIDVGGIDFAHPDFMDDEGNSRIVAIWDQGGDAFDPPRLKVAGARSRKASSYGSEITGEDIRTALREAPRAKLSPHALAPQSQRARDSHATHVASIAAGRSGVCKRARIAAVMVALPDSDLDRRKSFYDTTRIIDAIEYLFAVAEREGLKGVAINVSLGTNGGPHDASDLMSRWIDRAMAEPGRAICVAAGNSGQEAPQYEGDLGFWSGRVHASGKIPAAALRKDLEWVVVGNGFEDISENELEIWYSAADEFSVELFTPGGRRIGPVCPGEQIENELLADRTVVSIYNVLSDARNGDNRISLYLSPFMGDPVIGITAGVWRVRLTGKVVRNGDFNAWIERDDPRRGEVSAQWSLPSFFGPRTYVDNSTLSSLACGPRVIGVANFDEARELLNISSSQGPTRDGRLKPEIAAPGTDIVAAAGFNRMTPWVEMSGTSMASPHVTGVAALMLSLNPDLTSAQIGGIIRRTSNPMPGSTYEWRDDAGFGVVDPAACLREAVRIAQPVRDLTKRRRV